MKLLVLLSVAALVVIDFGASHPEPPSDSLTTSEKVNAVEDTAAPPAPAKPFYDFNNLYHGAFLPARFPPSNFLSTPTFPSFNYAPFRQNILPPLSQIIPPQLSQIVPPISQIVPPILSPNPQPSFPLPIQPFPPQLLPSSPAPPPVPTPTSTSTPKTLLNKLSFPYTRPLTNFPYSFPSPLTSSFPSIFSLPAPTFFPLPLQKQPPAIHKESLPTSYGPPSAAPENPEPEGPAENSAPFEPSAVSYPYEPSLPEEPEPEVPHKPAQEYGPPASK